MRRFVALALIATLLPLAACNTVDGAGKDLKSAGNAVENAVD